MFHFDAKNQTIWSKNEGKIAKIKRKNQSETKIKWKNQKKQKKAKKTKKSEKKEKSKKIDLNFASLCFASKQKLLNRSEAKNLKRKKRKKVEKSKKKKNRKKTKKYTWISLRFVSPRSENY